MSRVAARNPSLVRLALVTCLWLGVAVACASRPDPVPSDAVDAGPGQRPWYAGTPEMRRQLGEMVARIPRTEGRERVDLGTRIVSFGEPAVPVLVEALSSPDADVRGTAAWLLGFLGDPRSARHLAVAASDDDRLVRYEAGTSLLRMGDPRGFEPLLGGLEDPDPRIRAKCIRVLEERTGETFGYRADDRPEERTAAVARWRAWLRAQRGGGR